MSTNDPDWRPANVKALRPRHIVWQLRKDIFDKEVQSAATYSYMWLADQAGHTGLGIVLMVIAGLIVLLNPGLVGGGKWRVIVPFGVAFGLCAFWELNTFVSFRSKTTGVFARDTGSLASDALLATLYMLFGVVIGTSWQISLLYPDRDLNGWAWGAIALGATLFCLAAAFVIAYFALRPKIIWQKAGMPFLFRLANATVDANIAGQVKDYMNNNVQKEKTGQADALIITGPLLAGKTTLACGIGTEAAFSDLTVRYVTLDKLCEMGTIPGHDDAGPPNILYWRWPKSDVLIIDDVNSGTTDGNISGPANSNISSTAGSNISSTANSKIYKGDVRLFKEMIEPLQGQLEAMSTIWILGPKNKDFADWQDAIIKLYRRKAGAVVIDLGAPRDWPIGWFGRLVRRVRNTVSN